MFKLYLGNTGWLFAERALQLTLAFVVNLYVARYLQPANFGLLNYALSVVALASPLAALGLEPILIRELVQHPQDQTKWLGTAFVLKGTASLCLFLSLTGLQLLFGRNPILNGLVLLICAGLVLQSMNVVDAYFQSQVAARYSVQAKMITLLFSSAMKIVLITLKAPLIYFAGLIFAENVLLASALWLNYRRLRLPSFFNRFDMERAKTLLRQSWPLLLTGLAVAVYLKIDQVMLKRMLDAAAVGQYAAAVRISEALYFIPFALTSTFYPAIINAKSYGEDLYKERLQRFYDLMVWLGLLLALFVALLVPHFVTLLYGAAYAPAAGVLRWHGWALLFVFMTSAGSRYFLVENRQKTLLLINVTGAVGNILFNLWLIPALGIRGAAISTVLSYSMAGFFACALFRGARPNFYMLCNSMNPCTVIMRNKDIFRFN
ncbi:flippase [candidate division KSB1 bacterium]|nr:flippase [candidate division KSB1 bacterium]